MPVSRRAFLKYVAGGAGSVLVLHVVGPGGRVVAMAAVPGGTLDPATLPKFTDPLLVPPVMTPGRLPRRGGPNIDTYEISLRQFSQQVLPSGSPATTVWGYGQVGAGQHNAPSFTIEARVDTPVRITWVNDLVDAQGRYLPHLLPVDPTLHWANPEQRPGPDGVPSTDVRPDLTGLEYVPPEDFVDPDTQYTTYGGPVPMVVHLHGAMGVGQESDGYTEAWYLPAATDLPPGHATSGTWFDHLAARAAERFGVTWGPGRAVVQYPNHNRASTLWFHDHALGMTRLNVYTGPAGFYLLRGGPSGDSQVLDSRDGSVAELPGPAPRAGDRPGKPAREIPIAIQDRSFNDDGSLFYPDSRTFFDEAPGPWIPESDLSPVWNPEFFGNTLIANGRVWPYLEVEQRRYRLRLLNGCQSRFLLLDFSGLPGVAAWKIGSEGGFLAAPVDLTGDHGGRLLLAPAERADVLVDFAAVPLGNHVLRNIGPDEPFGGGEPGTDFEPADPATTGQVLQFRVGPSAEVDTSTPPEFLVLPTRTPLPAATRVRRLALLEEMSTAYDGPAAALLGVVHGDPAVEAAHTQALMWSDPVTEDPAVGSTELWEIYNASADAHPVHLHEVGFEVVDRQSIDVLEGEDGGEHASPRVRLAEGSLPRPPEPWEAGVKDTAISYPSEVLRLRATFSTPGRYVWHCHILEHEDNEMMRPVQVGPPAAGQPD